MTNPKATIKPPDPYIVELVEKHGRDPEAILEVLRDLEDQHAGLSADVIEDVAHSLRIPPSSGYGVASFYSMLSLQPRAGNVLRICDGPVCWLCGSDEVHKNASNAFEEDPSFRVERTSCLGLCDRAPAALVNLQQAGPVHPGGVHKLAEGWTGKALSYAEPRPGEQRIMLAGAGKIDPDSLESALANGAYQSLKDALTQDAETIINQVEASGLAGRGGAGFPVGRKWRFVAQADATPKYVICNADESEPLIFKDRVLIDTNPHQILEGMAIAGYATGATEAYIYIRGEYESQAKRLEQAIHQAEEAGYLGKNILDSGYNFKIHIHRGAGAYICGEETALIESLEGNRGEPRLRPPYPPSFGYRGLPTLVNNVETFAAVPAILAKGASWYHAFGNEHSHGTKIWMVLGHVNNPGLFEAPFGLTLRQVIEEFGGGMRPSSTFHFALTGGAAGTIVPKSLLDIPIDFTSAAQGLSLGAGAFLICDQTVSPVNLLHNLLNFFAIESCGKCTPCRVGTHRAHEILTNIVEGRGQTGDIGELHVLADYLHEASFCGLGQSVAIPMKSALKHFSNEFSAAASSK
jgi:NADH:ubiquinone oxidoreductase subunit F (NADH-binding)/NADH:ubiquinone oxidoreductase subunit E